ncbi:hypothetical protein [Enterobacter sp. CPE_E423]|uniref:hypothetical protein n=1 Tax=unclassified Enterobacter TaxID=2608935 RepID=UPI0039751DA6
MSTITKERLTELSRRENVGAILGEEIAELARIALASLEAVPVGEVSEQRDGLVMDGTVDLGGASTHRIIKGASKMKRLPLGTKFYTAPPAPVSVPDEMEMDDDFDSAFEHGKAAGWNACRAAMLQGAEPVSQPCTLREGVAAIRNSGIAIDDEKIFAERDALNSPVIPDGWKLVPIDPTKDMLRAGQSVVGFWLNTVHCYSKMLAAAPAAPQQEVK